MMFEEDEKILCFDEFEADLEQGVLRRSGSPVPLPPKVFEVLVALVRARGRILSKNELMDTVWAESFVEESNVTQSIYLLRKSLGAAASGTEIVETVPKRGFRLTAPVVAGSSVKADIEAPDPAGSVERRKRIAIFSVGLVIFLVCITALLVFRGMQKRSVPIENVKLQKLTFSGDISIPVISPDGKSIAYVRDDSIILQDVGTGSNLKLNVIDHSFFGNLQFSGDGLFLFFRNERRTDAGGDVFQVSRFGGAARRIVENSWSGIGTSPDGSELAFVRFEPKESRWILVVRKIEGGAERVVMERSSPDSIYRTGFPAWSPDGASIVTVAQERPSSVIYIVDSRSGEARRVETPRFVQIEQTVWTPDGRSVIAVARERERFFQLWKVGIDGAIERLTNDLSSYRTISISSDGRSLLAENQTVYSHIWLSAPGDAESLTQLTSGNINRDGMLGLDWTGDGEIIYSTRLMGDTDLWALRVSDSSARQLTSNAGPNNENPKISPDGRTIYFESNRGGSRHIWRSDRDGGNQSQVTFADGENDFYPEASPDGRFLFFIRRSPKGNVVMRQEMSNGETSLLTEKGKFSPNSFLALTADGRYLAFNNIKESRSERDEKTSEIGVIDLTNGDVRLFTLPRVGTNFSWADNGTMFDYCENDAEGGRIIRRNLDGSGQPKRILTIQKSSIFAFETSPDGKQLAIARGRQDRDAVLFRDLE